MSFPINSTQFEGLFRDAPDYLSLVVKSHYSIDQHLILMLQDALPKADALELGRVSFLLKFDFAAGMGLLRSDLRPIFALINTVRNRVAHNPYVEFSPKESTEIKNVLLSRVSPVVPDDFRKVTEARNILETLFAVGFINLEVARERLIVRMAESRITNQMVHEALSNKRPVEEPDLSVRERFEKLLKRYLDEHYGRSVSA